jgi:UDP-N-acetylmuramoylalanine--D-glutamate ligase
MTFSVKDRRVTVIGGGRSGLAAAALLVSRGARVTLADTAAAIDGAQQLTDLGVTLALGPHPAALLAESDLIVLSPGVPPGQEAIVEARRAGVPVIGEVELASRWIKGRIIAVTGTKGKSTTTTLVARMLERGGLRVTAGGNLGTALSAQVGQSTTDTIHVVEVSSFQLETTETFHPWVAVLLNLSPDHLDRHASFEEYAMAKARIFANQGAGDWAVVNTDDPAAVALARDARARRIDFALDAPVRDGVTVEHGMVVRREQGATTPLFPVASVKLPGRHLLSDVLAASAVASVVGVTPQAMGQAVETFAGLEHALERVAEVGDVAFVNDSKATNIAAAGRAIESFDDKVVVIMGGRFKGGRFEDLREPIAARADAVVAIGEAAPLIHAALDGIAPVRDARSMTEAVRVGFALARPGGVVLLAPACSSFDMFRDYAERGTAFKNEVRRLAMDVSAHKH